MTDPYRILGVSRDATPEQIKSAYRKLAKEYHPDRNREPGSEDRFKEVTAAYEMLRDPERHKMGEQAHRSPHFGFSFDGVDIDDILASFHMRQRQRGNDLTTYCTITLEEAFSGKDATLAVRTSVGVKHVTVRIPPGVDDNSRLRVPGAGEKIIAAHPTGDLYVVIRIAPHPVFSRAAQNILVQQPIDALDAILGGEIDIPTLDGSTLRVAITPGTQNGQRLRVTGRGMPVLGTHGQRGDMIVALTIRIPTNLDDETRSLLAAARSKMK